jgi:hypothetical protein
MPMGENLKVVCAEFSTLSLAVFVVRVSAWRRKGCPHLELKTRPRYCPANLFVHNLLFCKENNVLAVTRNGGQLFSVFKIYFIPFRLLLHW